MTWKLRLIEKYSGKARTIKAEAATAAEAKAYYEANFSRFNTLDKIEADMTKAELIETILADMEAKQSPRENSRKRFGGFLRSQTKAELEKILEARMS